MTSYKKLEKIAEACNVDVQTGSEDGRLVIQLWGRGQDIEKVIAQIDGYLDRWGDEGRAALAEKETVVSLYSGRIDWAKLGY